MGGACSQDDVSTAVDAAGAANGAVALEGVKAVVEAAGGATTWREVLRCVQDGATRAQEGFRRGPGGVQG